MGSSDERKTYRLVFPLVSAMKDLDTRQHEVLVIENW
jgi:hypothetical protein